MASETKPGLAKYLVSFDHLLGAVAGLFEQFALGRRG